MSRRFGNKNQEFLYFNVNYGTKIPKRFTNKTINVNVKSVVDRSPKKENKIATPRDVLNDFLESTSIHGLQYFGNIDIKVGVLGKILWTCAMLTGFVCLSLMVMQFLSRYRENPTNTYAKTFTAPIFQAPFPAVTICPLTPVPLRKQLEILDIAILPEDVSRELAMQFLKYGREITLPYSMKTFNGTDKLKLFLNANKWSISDFLKISHPCEEIFHSCWWNDELMACSKLIKYTYSSYGLCCSFNYLLEDLVGRDKSQPKIVPLNSVSFGPWSGLKLVIRNEIFISPEDNVHKYDSTMISDGVGLIIHHSLEYPGLNDNMYILQNGYNFEVTIRPTLIKKPVGMYHRNLDNKLVPMCVSENENNLEYFPAYQYSNCYTNCRMKAMIHICGCLPFTFNYLLDYHHISACDTNGIVCLQENTKKIAIVKDTENENFTCSCRTPCEYVIYDSLPNVIPQSHAGSIPFLRNSSAEHAVLKVFMESQTFHVFETLPAADEVYLLASIGGIFSLFLGCSFLSLMEIIYFAGLMCRAIFLNRKVKAASQVQQINKRRVY